MGDVMHYALTALNAFVFKRLIMNRIWLFFSSYRRIYVLYYSLYCTESVDLTTLRAENKEILAHECKIYFFQIVFKQCLALILFLFLQIVFKQCLALILFLLVS